VGRFLRHGVYPYPDPWSGSPPKFCSLVHCQTSLKMSCKSVRLRKIPSRQTDKQRLKHNLLGGRNKPKNPKAVKDAWKQFSYEKYEMRDDHQWKRNNNFSRHCILGVPRQITSALSICVVVYNYVYGHVQPSLSSVGYEVMLVGDRLAVFKLLKWKKLWHRHSKHIVIIRPKRRSHRQDRTELNWRVNWTRHRASTSTRWHFAFGDVLS